MDYPGLASDLLRALRGKRSQPAFARWAGYKSNVAYIWESGRAFPTAAQALALFERKGLDLRALHTKFYRREPDWLAQAHPASRAGVAAFLDDLRGRATLRSLAKATGHSRFAVARWLSGESEVRLPEFLALVQGASLRSLDFVALLADPSQLPSVAADWQRLEAARRAAYELPWSQAVLRALELAAYRALPRHEPGWIAAHLGISQQTEDECLSLLQASGQLRIADGRYQLNESMLVDTRREPHGAWKARAFWTTVALDRLRAQQSGAYTYNVFGVSAKDFERIRELQARHFRELRALIAQSEPVERVGLLVQHLIDLDGPKET
jgi:hypothetical protein